jgi:hypothetical protein
MEPARRPAAGGSRPAGRPRGAIVAGIVGYALVAALCRPLTGPALLAVLAAGLPVFWIGVHRPPRVARPVGVRSAAGWLGVGGVAAVYELGLRLGPDDLAHPTLSTLADPALATYPGRALGYVLWLGVGGWLVSR